MHLVGFIIRSTYVCMYVINQAGSSGNAADWYLADHQFESRLGYDIFFVSVAHIKPRRRSDHLLNILPLEALSSQVKRALLNKPRRNT